jgi:valacyclovir hydrolase
MRVLGFNRYSILGWSGGGITGMFMASKYPETVSKLVLIASRAYIDEKDAKALQLMRDVQIWDPFTREKMEGVYGKEGLQTLWSRFLDENQPLVQDICSQDLPLIKCPTLLLHGTKDRAVFPKHSEYISTKIVNSTLITFPEGKHNIHLQFPKEFNEKVQNFLLQ